MGNAKAIWLIDTGVVVIRSDLVDTVGFTDWFNMGRRWLLDMYNVGLMLQAMRVPYDEKIAVGMRPDGKMISRWFDDLDVGAQEDLNIVGSAGEKRGGGSVSAIAIRLAVPHFVRFTYTEVYGNGGDSEKHEMVYCGKYLIWADGATDEPDASGGTNGVPGV